MIIEDRVLLYSFKSGAGVAGSSVIILILSESKLLGFFVWEILSRFFGTKDKAIYKILFGKLIKNVTVWDKHHGLQTRGT